MKFSFGKNWRSYVDNSLSEELISRSQHSLGEFLGIASLEGRSFLDIGSGSGVHSVAALRLGAEQILSFDIDPDSVRATQIVYEKEGAPAKWSIKQGSILDSNFTRDIPQFDIVYSWGVLHHTGEMWKAIDIAATKVKQGGELFIGIYATTSFSPVWLRIKQAYNRAPKFVSKIMEYLYASYLLMTKILRGKDPIAHIKQYRSHRGMSFMHDISDWLGGLPYEYARPEEVILRLKKQGFELTNLDTKEECVQYLFVKAPRA